MRDWVCRRRFLARCLPLAPISTTPTYTLLQVYVLPFDLSRARLKFAKVFFVNSIFLLRARFVNNSTPRVVATQQGATERFVL